jgi:hypothetical protein
MTEPKRRIKAWPPTEPGSFADRSSLELAELARGNAALYHAEGPNATLKAFLLEVALRLEALTAAANAEPPGRQRDDMS